MRLHSILSICSVISTNVSIHGITHLGIRSHPTGSSTNEAVTTTVSFFSSDQTVYTTVSIRPVDPSTPASAVAERLSFFTTGSPIPIIQYLWMSLPRVGMPIWGITHIGVWGILGTWSHTDCKLHINCLELNTNGLQ